jgi:hypothetical protein
LALTYSFLARIIVLSNNRPAYKSEPNELPEHPNHIVPVSTKNPMMSFGWSASDIAKAIKVFYSLIEALDDLHGAANDYREAVAFLGDVNRTLEPLQAFTAWNAYPEYGQEIGEQVGRIKAPVEKFLAAVLKYEPSLGTKAKRGWDKSVPATLRKLEWHMVMPKKVLKLRREVESHMRILDSLMQRLTL